jgi:TP901 family phage tail tape measure protein
LGGVGRSVIGQAVLEIITDNSRANRELSGMQRNLAAGVVTAFGAATVAATGFETRMTRIETLVGVNRETVRGWTQDVLRLGTVTGRGPNELAEALFVVTSAGERGAGAMAILESSAKAAASGLGETAEIARAVTAVMQAYASSGMTAARATDVLLATVREGNLEAGALAGSLGRVLGLAAQVGVSFEEVGAFIATYTRLGVSAEEATTGLRAILAALLRPTVDARNAMAEAGISARGLRDIVERDGLGAALEFLIDAFRGNDEQLIRVIPNIRALSAVLGTAGSQADAYRQIIAAINDSLGLNEEAWARTAETTEVAARRLAAAVQVMLITIGAEVLPVVAQGLEAIVGLVTSVADGFGMLPGPVRSTLVVLALLGAIWPVLAAGMARFNVAGVGVIGTLRGINTAAVAMRGGMAVGAIGLSMLASESDNAFVSMAAMMGQGALLGGMFGGPFGLAAGAAAGALLGVTQNLIGARVEAEKTERAIARVTDELDRQAAAAAGRGDPFSDQEQAMAALIELFGIARGAANLYGDTIDDIAERGALLASSLDLLLDPGRAGQMQRERLGLGDIDEGSLRLLREIAGATGSLGEQFRALDAVIERTGGTWEQVQAIGRAFGVEADALARLFPRLAAAAARAAGEVDALGNEATGAEQDVYDLSAAMARLNSTAIATEFALRLLTEPTNPLRWAALWGEAAGAVRESLELQLGAGFFSGIITELADPGGDLRAQLDAMFGGTAARRGGGGGGAARESVDERIARQRAEEVFTAIVEAQVAGRDPERAVAAVRREHERLNELWPTVVEQARRFGIELTDEMRIAFERAGREVERQGQTIGSLMSRLLVRRLQEGRDGGAAGLIGGRVAERAQSVFRVEGDLIIGPDSARAVSVQTVQRGFERARFSQVRE